jgi:hypothetical protein
LLKCFYFYRRRRGREEEEEEGRRRRRKEGMRDFQKTHRHILLPKCFFQNRIYGSNHFCTFLTPKKNQKTLWPLS